MCILNMGTGEPGRHLIWETFGKGPKLGGNRQGIASLKKPKKGKEGKKKKRRREVQVHKSLRKKKGKPAKGLRGPRQVPRKRVVERGSEGEERVGGKKPLGRECRLSSQFVAAG